MLRLGIRTKEELQSLQHALSELEMLQYKTSPANFKQELHELALLNLYQQILEVKAEPPQRDVSKEDIKQFVSIVRTELAHYVSVNCTLAYTPSGYLTNQIYSVISTTLQHPFVLHFHTDTSLVGGLTLEYKGKFLDLSIKRLIATGGI